MKLFKANQSHQSEADRAASLRLDNIASRYRVDPDSSEEVSIEIVSREEAPRAPEPGQ